MVTCPKLNNARAPSSNTLEELEEVQNLSRRFGDYPGSPADGVWMSMTDSVEEGVWRDYYTRQEVSQSVLTTEIGGLKENSLHNCGIVS